MFIRRIHFIQVLASFYSFLFLILRPKKVVVNCFYSSDSLAIILACKRKRIPVFDYQHGVQGKQHYAYADWGKLSDKEMIFLPDGFYLWDAESASHYANWNNKTQLEIVGNGLLNLSDRFADLENETITEIHKKLSHKTLVLFTLQDILPPKWLFSVIKNNQGIGWLLRLHPQYRNLRESVISELSDCDNWEIDLNTQLNIMTDLKISALHITVDSSVVLQALQLSKNNIIIGKNGYNYYKHLENEKLVHFAISQNELNTLILDISKTI